MKGNGKIYFISDIHFGHTNILKLSKRPFESIEEMDNHIINEWNNRVTDDDIVYIIGDFWYRGKDNAINYEKLKRKY